MAQPVHMPVMACEHLNQEAFEKIKSFQKLSKEGFDPNFIQYKCLQCETTGSFNDFDEHFAETSHNFAISQKSVYCGGCKDLVYEPRLFYPGAKGKKRKLAQADENDESYMTANTISRPCGREGVRGLFNLGETCYMNAVLQMMVHNPLLASYFLGKGHPISDCPYSKDAKDAKESKETKDSEKKTESESSDEEQQEEDKQKACVACGMTEVFSDAAMSDAPLPAHAVNLLFASWKNIPHMSGKSQQDAQEWFMMIVDKLHERVRESTGESKNSHCNCFFHKIFFGRLYSEITCDKCNAISTTEDEYSSISLDFKKQVRKRKKAALALPDIKTGTPNVYECLRSYTAPEPLSPDQYKCRSCEAQRSATKRLRIRKLPAILCVHVKRFGVKIVGSLFQQEKYEGKLDFPLALDMAPYTTNPKSIAPATTPNQGGKYMYDLECVVVHQGENSHTGHYYSFCRQDNRWFRFDDEIVSATTTEDVMRQEAYLLFYSLRSIGQV